MHTPVFLDHLPDIDAVSGSKPAQYQLKRNRALLDLMLDESTQWLPRTACPACGQPLEKSRNFSQALIEFQRCTRCNSVYSTRVPHQSVLDQLRLDLLREQQDPTGGAEDTATDREFEFTSLMNWVSLTEARLERSLDHILDIRFSSQAPGWQDATARLSHNRRWEFLPLISDSNDFANLSNSIQASAPKAILMPAELDRVADPRALLQAIKTASAPGTVIFLASSCADSLEYEILGADSPSFIPLDRLTVFSIQGLQEMSEALGFSILERSTPGRLDAVILDRYFKSAENADIPFWSGFFRDADKNRLRDLQILLQRSLKSSLLRFVLET